MKISVDDVIKIFQFIKTLEAENKWLRELTMLRSDLLVCYRIGKRPSEKLLNRLQILGQKELLKINPI